MFIYNYFDWSFVVLFCINQYNIVSFSFAYDMLENTVLIKETEVKKIVI